MSRLLTKNTRKLSAILTVALAWGFGSVSQAQTFVQNFEAGTSMPATTFFTHDGISTATQIDSLADESLPGVVAFAGAGGGSVGSAAATLGLSSNGGVGGSQAGTLTLTNDGTTDFSFAGILQSVGFAPTVPTDFTVSADVLAPVGYPLALSIESPFGPTNNGFILNFLGDNTVESVLIVGTSFIGIPVGDNQEIIVDNLSLTPTTAGIPEPTSIAVLMSLGSIIAVRRRRT